jgi:hypothetical protein
MQCAKSKALRPSAHSYPVPSVPGAVRFAFRKSPLPSFPPNIRLRDLSQQKGEAHES